jgi:hypothetical protein
MISFLLLATMVLPTECLHIGPLYWEIGDVDGTVEFGIRGSTVHSETVMPISTATQWLFAAYVAETGKLKGELAKDSLRMTSGYTEMNPRNCINATTVASCMARAGGLVAENKGRFFYNAGHDQHLAVAIGLGPDTPAKLTTKMRAALHVPVEMRLPQPAGGAVISATGYALFLRKLLKHQLKLSAFLGKDPVGENPVSSPVPASWRYSYGHWIEDDGSYSSPGSFGFYPWLSGKTYGIVARSSTSRQGYMESAICGRALRKAFEEKHK